jgi:hypothetical protein
MLVGNSREGAACKIEFAGFVEKVLCAIGDARLPEPDAGMIRQHDRDRGGPALREFAQQPQAAVAAQVKVRHHDVGCRGDDAVEGGTGLLGFPYDLDGLDRTETCGHSRPERNRVVHEEHAQGWL